MAQKIATKGESLLYNGIVYLLKDKIVQLKHDTKHGYKRVYPLYIMMML